MPLGCRYQFLQEPISELYCRPSTSTILVGCTVISKTSGPSVLIVWFVNRGSGEQRLQPGQVENLSQSNSTYRIVTNIVGVSNNPGSIYWCRPQFSNGTFLKSSQAFTVRSVPSIYTQCHRGDVFSTDSTFCADRTESITPPSSQPSITDSSYGPTKSKDKSTNSPPIYITRTNSVTVTDSSSSANVTTTVLSESTDIVVTQDNVALAVVLPILGLLCLIVVIQSIVNVVLFLKLKRVKPVKQVITRQKSEVRTDRNINTVSAASYAYPLPSNAVVVNGNQQPPSTTVVSSNQSPNATVVNGNQQPPDSDSSNNYASIQQHNTTEPNTNSSFQSSRNPPQLYGNYLIPIQTLQASSKGYASLLKETMATHNIYTRAQTKDSVYY